MTHSELKKQQEVQLKMLVDFDAFCKVHNLRCFLFYGTLLGAVRHKGFIPWDYDIDTAMTRAEYNELKKIQHLLPDHLSIVPVCYSDIDHAGLSRIIYHDKELGNVHIDIFILDYGKEGWTNNRFWRRLCRLLHFAKLSKKEKSFLIKYFSGQPLKQTIIHFSKIVRLFFGGSANTERLIFKLLVNKLPSTKFLTLEDHKRRWSVDLFTSYDTLEFDGYFFYVPKNVDEILTSMYGNYMDIPKEGHQWLKEEGLE